MRPKYYIYISDAKIEMLLPQIPHELKKKVANEFKLSFKIFEIGHKSESESEDSRSARLQSVVEYLRSGDQVGSVDQPSEYIEGTLPMKWGPYVLLSPNFQAADPNADRARRPTDFVLFGGATEKTFCGLVGSARHLVGSVASKDGAEDYAGSAMPAAMHYLEELASGLGITHSDDTLNSMGSLLDRLRGPAQRLEFVAKRLLEGSVKSGPRTQCVLASPLYVALAE